MGDSVQRSAPSLAGPWLALLIFAVPIATAGALCSLVAPWWVIHLEAAEQGVTAELQQRWLFVIPVRQRDLGTLHAAELHEDQVQKAGPVRIGGGVKKTTYRLTLRHGKDRITELAAGRAEKAERALTSALSDPSRLPTTVWTGKPGLGLWAPVTLLLTAFGLIAAFFTRLLGRPSPTAGPGV